jgi:hypothetical protein
MAEPTGVAKDQKQTPKKPYNADVATCARVRYEIYTSRWKALTIPG